MSVFFKRDPRLNYADGPGDRSKKAKSSAERSRAVAKVLADFERSHPRNEKGQFTKKTKSRR